MESGTAGPMSAGEKRASGASAQNTAPKKARSQWPFLTDPPAQVLCQEELQGLLLAVNGPSGEPPVRALDFLETFSGDVSMTRGMRQLGFIGAAMDLRVNPNHDLMTQAGFLVTLKLLSRIRPGGLFWAAPPCSSWVFLNMGTSGRRAYREAGAWETNAKIKCQNALAARVAALCFLASTRGVWWLVEQPSSSLMFGYLPWACVAEGLRPSVIRTHMGAFGGPTAKLTLIAGTAPFLQDLKRSLSPEDSARIEELQIRTAIKAGGGGVHGSKDLKATQSYPLQFGTAVAVALRDCHGASARLVAPPPLVPAPRDSGDGELWHATPKWFLDGVLPGTGNAGCWETGGRGEFVLTLS